MPAPRPKTPLLLLLLAGLAAALAWGIHQRLQTSGRQAAGKGDKPPVPVQTAAVEHGPIELLRTFTGTLEARAEFVVAPKIGGRVESLAVDLADPVARGQVVAVLDDAEFVQAVARAEAELAVERASHAEARSLLQIAERELKRVTELRERGTLSESQRDAVKAGQLAKQALVEVSQARIARAEAELAAARIRLGYTRVSAGWSGGGERRLVAERHVDAGETVAANAPLLRIVELDPITGVFFITERDYARLQNGQTASLATDAYPGERFHGEIERIAPVFREATRQARVELRIDNPDLRLKPGMFVRATVTLERVAEATIVPEQALVSRDGRDGLFLVGADGATAVWREVRALIRQGQRVQVAGEGIEGQVVILGQQLLDDGAPLRVVEQRGDAAP